LELKSSLKAVFKLFTVNNSGIIQGLIAVEDKKDHIFLHLLEGAKFNKGKNKLYLGVAGNLAAFACRISFDKGYEGFVAFDSKTALIEHYEKSLGATHFRGQRMFIETRAAAQLGRQILRIIKIMKLAKEPKEVDFVIKSEPWTEKDLTDFSDLIKEIKSK
jgi:hypothetical protein